MVARYDTRNPDALRRLIAAGTPLRPFARKVVEACHREALALEAELAARSPEFRRIHESWAKARDDMRAWFRVAELSFDNFLAQAAARRRAGRSACTGPGRRSATAPAGACAERRSGFAATTRNGSLLPGTRPGPP